MRYIVIIVLALIALLGDSWGGAAQGTTPTYQVMLPMVEYNKTLPIKTLNSIVGSPTCEDFDSLGAERLMMWFPTCQTECGRVFNPMVRDVAQLEMIESGVIELTDCDEVVIGFNEPENPDCEAGACMTLVELVDAWHRLEIALPNHQLTSPQFVELTDYTPPYTLDVFIAAVGTPFDITAVHFYGQYDVERSLQQWQDWYTTFPSDKPVWVTELGWMDSSGWQNGEQDAAAFLSAFLVDCQEKGVEVVNWFGVRESAEYPSIVPLLDSTGLTEVGTVWSNW